MVAHAITNLIVAGIAPYLLQRVKSGVYRILCHFFAVHRNVPHRIDAVAFEIEGYGVGGFVYGCCHFSVFGYGQTCFRHAVEILGAASRQ